MKGKTQGCPAAGPLEVTQLLLAGDAVVVVVVVVVVVGVVPVQTEGRTEIKILQSTKYASSLVYNFDTNAKRCSKIFKESPNKGLFGCESSPNKS